MILKILLLAGVFVAMMIVGTALIISGNRMADQMLEDERKKEQSRS